MISSNKSEMIICCYSFPPAHTAGRFFWFDMTYNYIVNIFDNEVML